MVGGRTRPELDADRQLNLSLVRLLEIVGEAANRFPKEERTRYSGIAWPEIDSFTVMMWSISISCGRSSPRTCHR